MCTAALRCRPRAPLGVVHGDTAAIAVASALHAASPAAEQHPQGSTGQQEIRRRLRDAQD